MATTKKITKKRSVKKVVKKKTQPATILRKVKRASPGSSGTGRFYHVVIRPKEEFKTFRVQDVGMKGGLERVAGKRADGTWDTEAWLIEKKDAKVVGGKLVITEPKAKSILKQIDGPIRHIEGDIWKAHAKVVHHKTKR
jgi:hypothetical protein